jgi:hypothetical protein
MGGGRLEVHDAGPANLAPRPATHHPVYSPNAADRTGWGSAVSVVHRGGDRRQRRIIGVRIGGGRWIIGVGIGGERGIIGVGIGGQRRASGCEEAVSVVHRGANRRSAMDHRGCEEAVSVGSSGCESAVSVVHRGGDRRSASDHRGAKRRSALDHRGANRRIADHNASTPG